MYPTIIFFTLLLHCAHSFHITENEKATIKNDIDYLTNGVTNLRQLHSQITDLRPFRKFAYSLANTTSRQVWSAARYGEGKICAFSSNALCRMDSKLLAAENNSRMMENCINWITNQTTGLSAQQPVGLITTAHVFNKNFAKSQKTGFQTLADLQGIKFLLLDQTAVDGFSENQIEVVKEFVSKRGGGLFVCNEPKWPMTNEILSLNKGNQLLFEAGLVWTTQRDYYWKKIGVSPALHDFWDKNVWYQSKRILESEIPDVDDCAYYSTYLAEEFLSSNRSSWSEKYVNAFHIIPVYNMCCGNNETFMFPIYNHSNRMGFNCIPFAQKIRYVLPLNYDHPIVKAAEVFPGYPNVTRKTVTIQMPFLLNQTKWHSTGLFVYPGSTLHAIVPAILVNSSYTIQIGCHNRVPGSDLPLFRRWPWVVESYPIHNTNLKLFSFTGGLLYLTVPSITASNWETATVNFTGELVFAPWFRLGVTTESQWKDMVAKNVVSIAEIESNLITVTVTSTVLSEIENVTATALWNDAHVSMNYELRGNKYKGYKERMQFDVQTGCQACSGEAGYPIVATEVGHHRWSTLLVTPVVDISIITDNITIINEHHKKFRQWLRYHELGHNFQLAAWTPHGEGKVTCNIFSLYNKEKYPDGHHLFGDYDRPLIKDGIWGSLSFYIELRHAFGWVAFKQFFRIFENNETLMKSGWNDAPNNWLMYFSQTVNRNIYPLYVEYKRHENLSAEAVTYAANFDDFNKSKIVGCQGTAFVNSPCMTAEVFSSGFLYFTVVTWARINRYECLELTFPDAPNGTRILSGMGNFLFSGYNTTSKTVRLVPIKRIKSEDRIDFSLHMHRPFEVSDIKVKIVDIASNMTILVPERSLEEIIYHNKG